MLTSFRSVWSSCCPLLKYAHLSMMPASIRVTHVATYTVTTYSSNSLLLMYTHIQVRLCNGIICFEKCMTMKLSRDKTFSIW